MHSSPWISNILCLSGFILGQNHSQLGEGVVHLGPAGSQQPLSLATSDWPKPRKPVIIHSISVLGRLASTLHLFASALRILLGCELHY